MERDPKFINNKDKFFGVSKGLGGKSAASQTKSKLSAAQKLDNYIQFQ